MMFSTSLSKYHLLLLLQTVSCANALPLNEMAVY